METLDDILELLLDDGYKYPNHAHELNNCACKTCYKKELHLRIRTALKREKLGIKCSETQQ